MTKLYVYWNSHNKMFSVRYGPRVSRYVNCIYLTDVSFKVSKSGREKVLRQKRKNVHAFVVGYEWQNPSLSELPHLFEVVYNPYLNESFMIKELEQPIFSAKLVKLINGKVFLLEA
jgi:hypothetical protein